MLTMSHNKKLKKKWSYDDVFTISHTTKVKICCPLMMFVDAENRRLVQFIYNKLHVSSYIQVKKLKDAHCKIW